MDFDTIMRLMAGVPEQEITPDYEPIKWPNGQVIMLRKPTEVPELPDVEAFLATRGRTIAAKPVIRMATQADLYEYTGSPSMEGLFDPVQRHIMLKAQPDHRLTLLGVLVHEATHWAQYEAAEWKTWRVNASVAEFMETEVEAFTNQIAWHAAHGLPPLEFGRGQIVAHTADDVRRFLYDERSSYRQNAYRFVERSRLDKLEAMARGEVV